MAVIRCGGGRRWLSWEGPPLSFQRRFPKQTSYEHTCAVRRSPAHPVASIQTVTWAIYLPTNQVVVWGFETNRSFVKRYTFWGVVTGYFINVVSGFIASQAEVTKPIT